MKMKFIQTLPLTARLAFPVASLAFLTACGQKSSTSDQSGSMPMSDAKENAPAAGSTTAHGGSPSASAGSAAMMEPVKTVYTDYIKIQKALAKDSLDGVPAVASGISSKIKGDSMKMLPTAAADQADKLAQAKDIKAAREAFKPLSDSLIAYLDSNNVKDTGYNQAFCPMAKAKWLQTESEISNPYMGKAMPSCGEIQKKF